MGLSALSEAQHRLHLPEACGTGRMNDRGVTDFRKSYENAALATASYPAPASGYADDSD